MTNNMEAGLTAFDDAGTEGRALDVDVFDLVEELRHGHYREGRGTWYNATFALERGGQLVDEYDFDHPPFGGMRDPAEASDDDEAEVTPTTSRCSRTTGSTRLDLGRLPAWHPIAIEARPPAPLLAAAPAGWQQLTMARAPPYSTPKPSSPR